jgi:hypothetical protein
MDDSVNGTNTTGSTTLFACYINSTTVNEPLSFFNLDNTSVQIISVNAGFKSACHVSNAPNFRINNSALTVSGAAASNSSYAITCVGPGSGTSNVWVTNSTLFGYTDFAFPVASANNANIVLDNCQVSSNTQSPITFFTLAETFQSTLYTGLTDEGVSTVLQQQTLWNRHTSTLANTTDSAMLSTFQLDLLTQPSISSAKTAIMATANHADSFNLLTPATNGLALSAVQANLGQTGSGDMDSVAAVYGTVNISNGSVSDVAAALYSGGVQQTSTGTIANAYGIYAANNTATNVSAGIGKSVGVFIEQQTAGYVDNVDLITSGPRSLFHAVQGGGSGLTSFAGTSDLQLLDIFSGNGSTNDYVSIGSGAVQPNPDQPILTVTGGMQVDSASFTTIDYTPAVVPGDSLGKPVATVSVSSAGINYIVGDILYLIQSGARGAVAVVMAAPGGNVTQALLVSPGYNYFAGTLSTTTDNAGTGCAITITVGSNSSGRAIQTLTVTNGGTLYQANDIISIVQAGGLQSLIQVLTVIAGAVTTFQLLSGGFNYSVGTATATNNHSGTAATFNITATTNFGGGLATIAINAAGNNYNNGDIVRINGYTLLGSQVVTTGVSGLAVVTTAGPSGPATALTLIGVGQNYSLQTATTTAITGSGNNALTVNITAVTTVPTDLINAVDRISTVLAGTLSYPIP